MGSEQSTQKPKQPASASFEMRMRNRFAELATAKEPHDVLEWKEVAALLSAEGANDFGNLLLQVDDTCSTTGLNCDQYVHAIVEALGLESADANHIVESRAKYFSRVFAGKNGTLNQDDLAKMVTYACILSLTAGLVGKVTLPTKDSDVIKGIVKSINRYVEDTESIMPAEIEAWVAGHCPDIFSGMVRWIELQAMTVVSGESPDEQEHTYSAGHSIPMFDTNNVKAERILDYSALWCLTTSLPDAYSLCPTWTLLYSSSEHGHSANRFQHHTKLYTGPTVMILRCEGNQMLGVCMDVEWKESDNVRGNEHCRVFSLIPQFHVKRIPIKVYNNSKTRHKDHGLGFGEDPTTKESAMLWLTNDFSQATVRFVPVVNQGEEKEIHVLSIEVWGCGSKSDADRQENMKKRDERAAELRQKAKRPGKWSGDEDRYLLELAGHTTDARLDIDHERELHGQNSVTSPTTD